MHHILLYRQEKKSFSAGKSITIKVKSEALTPANNLQHTHDTRCRKQKSERRLTIKPPPLKLPNHARALALLTPIVPSSTKSPTTKKSKSGERFVGCCSCSLQSKCSNMRCLSPFCDRNWERGFQRRIEWKWRSKR